MSPLVLLRLEGAVVPFAAVAGYAFVGASWWLFLALLLVPDAFMAGYLIGPRLGALVYNAGHTYLVPIVLGGMALGVDHALLGAVALIWTAHIGMDRALGYGLKQMSGFWDTHLRPPEGEGTSPDARRKGAGPRIETNPVRP